MESDVPAVENPQKLERAILNLITNLNNPASYDDDNVSLISDSTIETDDTRRTKSPPLSIIPPKANSIKTSIFRGVGIMGHTSMGRSQSIKDEPKSPETPNQTVQSPRTCQEAPGPLNIKIEPTSNMLSPPSSSMSSVDSDASSPFVANSHQHHAGATNERVYTTSRQTTPTVLATNPNKLDDFYTPSYDGLPVYDIDPSSSAVSAIANDSIMIVSNSVTVNNNHSNNNRNSVLKRTYKSDENDDDYSELIKKQALSSRADLNSPIQATPNPTTLELIATSASGKFDLKLDFLSVRWLMLLCLYCRYRGCFVLSGRQPHRTVSVSSVANIWPNRGYLEGNSPLTLTLIIS